MAHRFPSLVVVDLDSEASEVAYPEGTLIYSRESGVLAIADGELGASSLVNIAWGDISGSLVDQVDLEAILNGKSATVHSHAPSDVTGTAVVTADARLSDARTPTAHAHAPSDITGTAVVTADARLSDARTPLSHTHPESEVIGLVSDLAGKEAANSNIQAHVASAHAPSNAQKNSDITKAEIEAKLTGEIASHTHAGGAAFTLITVEKGLGTIERKAGRFTITGSGLTPGKAVLITQAAGPYTNKGTRVDEAEMDGLTVRGKVLDATTIECFWNSPTWVRGNYKFDYLVSA